VSLDDGQTWSQPLSFKREGHELSGNPVIAIDSSGKIYALCMSVNEGYGGGSLDLAISADHGQTWSDWTTS
jgi:hypothetical protein